MSKVRVSSRVPRQYAPDVIAELLRSLEDQLNALTEGKGVAYHGARTAAPTTGNHSRGDWFKNSAPSAGGYFGWVCTASGSPGTFKGFGAIEA